MRISQFVLLSLTIFFSLLAFNLLSAVNSAWNEHRTTVRGSTLANAVAAWVDGQVALSLERSLVQVALANNAEDRPVLIASLQEFRGTVDEKFATAMESAGRLRGDGLSGVASFLEESDALFTELKSLRDEIDAALREAGAHDEAAGALVGRLIDLVDRSFAIRENLSVRSAAGGGYARGLAEIQRLSWETREFVGRVRTFYAVATLTSEPFDSETKVKVAEQLSVAMRAWRALTTVAATVELPEPLAASIASAETVFWRDHFALMARIDQQLFELSAGFPRGGIIDFPTFFGASTQALVSIETISTEASRAIAAHWLTTQRQMTTQFWVAIALAIGALILVAMVVSLLRWQVVKPIAAATDLITRVSSGDLTAAVARRRRELSEIGALHDALERFRLGLQRARQAEMDAKTDALTGLPNRRHLEELLDSKACDLFEVGDCFFFIDLDGFKPINDTFGHHAGDEVLREIGQRLRRISRADQECWRLGGDEFGLILRGKPSEAEARLYADTILEAIGLPIPYDDVALSVRASIGVATYHSTELRSQELLSRADFAMFSAKQNPSKNVEFYREARSTQKFNVRDRREIQNALAAGQFVPLYQPQFDLRSQELTGFEALARWRMPNGSLSAPAQFLDMIEYFEVFGEFDLTIVERVLETMRRLREVSDQSPRFSVNISEQTLASSDAAVQLLALFDRFSREALDLTVEITENALIDRSASAIRQTIEAFSARHVRLSMDDFGTGYGSFRHLQEYKFDEIKIDRSFVAKLGEDHQTSVIIEGFLAIARGLNATVVAEGVETQAQLATLRAMGCEQGQGFLFGRPVEEAALAGLLASSRRRRA